MKPPLESGSLKLSSERELLTIQPIPVVRYQNEQLAALTVYSIYWLRIWRVRPTVKTITVLNHRLFPERFGMDSFPEFPDANRTQRSLLQCGPKYRGWLSGSNKRGYENDNGNDGLYKKIVDFMMGEYFSQKRENLRLKKREIELKAERLRLRQEWLIFKRDRYDSWKKLMEEKGRQEENRFRIRVQLQRERLELRKKQLFLKERKRTKTGSVGPPINNL